TGPIIITYNKVGPLNINRGPFLLTEASAGSNFMWGVFDATTNVPVIFPTGTDIGALENQVLMQITTSAFHDATNGIAYSPVVALGGSGGTRPYTWAIASNSSSGLPTGMFLSASGIISGTPAAGSGGVYDITIQMTDAGQRSVVRDFVLTVH